MVKRHPRHRSAILRAAALLCGRVVSGAERSIAGSLIAAVAVAPAMAQQLDPRVLQQIQNQLGASSSPSPQLDQAREQGARQPTTPTLPTVPQETLEERELRRQQSRVQLEEYYTPSPIEREYQERLGDPTLRQFGYDLFRSTQSGSGPLTGQVSDNYVLGIGDDLVVTFQGANNDSRTARVDREGRLIVGQLRPIRAAGRTLGAVRRELQAETRRTLLGTDVYVSLGSVRSITVFVGGEVDRPGQYQMTSLADVAAALAQAGGVRSTGSLRRVRVVRGGATVSVDLYGLLGIGTPPAVRLQDGDRIIVPVIGDTVAVAGNVARPGIYELRGSASASQVLAYAGGAVRPRGNTITVSRIEADGAETFVKLSNLDQTIVAGDAIQVVTGSAGGTIGRVMLRGYVLNPGPRSLAAAPTVRDLLGGVQDLRLGTYLPMAVLIRRDPQTSARLFEPVNLVASLRDGQSVPLRSDDRLYVFSRSDIDFINRGVVRRIILGQPNTLPQCRSLERLEALVADTQSPRFNVVTRGTFIVERNGRSDIGVGAGSQSLTGVRQVEQLQATAGQLQTEDAAKALAVDAARPGAQIARQDGNAAGAAGTAGLSTARDPLRGRNFDREGVDALCPAVFEEEPELLPVLIEHAVGVGGEVRRPGAYPVAGTVTAETMASVAEGLLTRAQDLVLDVTRSTGSNATMERFAADQGGVTLTRIAVRAGDDIRFNAAQPQYEPGGVLLSGEFQRPGLYTIRKGETLSQLIARAGGLTPQAYPYGSVFTRRSVKELQQEGFRRTARELNTSLLSVAARKETSGDALLGASRLIESLSTVEAPGRMVVETDPRVLELRPDLDTILESGDAIYVPKKPNFVLALGDVSNPGALQFVPGKSVGDYLREAGGTQSSADDGRIFIVLPNGTSQPVKNSPWRRSNMVVPPGSTIIVPKNIDPLFTLDIVRDVTGIVGQFVTAVASIAILANDN